MHRHRASNTTEYSFAGCVAPTRSRPPVQSAIASMERARGTVTNAKRKAEKAANDVMALVENAAG